MRSTSSTDRDLSLFIQSHLLSKYDSFTSSCWKKPISDILDDRTIAPDTLAYKDIGFLIRENEYLRRIYHTFNSSEEPEIENRLKRLVDIYTENSRHFMTFEYPTMILTSTEKIFINRKEMQRRRQAIDLSQQMSSYQSRSPSIIDFVNGDSITKHVLKFAEDYSFNEMESSLFQGFYEPSFSSEASYDSDVHDIYEVDPEEEQANQVNHQPNIQPLIIDFTEEDAIDLRHCSASTEFQVLTSTEADQKTSNPEVSEQKKSKPKKYRYRPLRKSKQMSSMEKTSSRLQQNLKKISKERQKISKGKYIMISSDEANSILTLNNNSRGRKIREKAIDLLCKIDKESPNQYVFKS